MAPRRGLGAPEPGSRRGQRPTRRPVSTPPTPPRWGATLGNAVYVWRSGVGVTANGALVYVGGPGLNITDLADLLVRAGAVRAMELDINTDWVNFSTYIAGDAAGPATAARTGPNSSRAWWAPPGRYFEPWWARDFITMSSVRVSG